MFIKKYLLLCILPLFLSGESIVGKWEINSKRTEQSIDKLSLDENQKKLFMFLSSAGFKSIECFSNKTCIQNAVTNINSCMGNFQWEKNNNDYILTPYTDKSCPNTASISKKTKVTIQNNNLNFLMANGPDSFSFIYTKTDATPSKKPLNNLIHIKYNKVYKSKVVDTYLPFSLLPTYFYLVFTDKNNFYSLATTQSDISSTKKIKDLIHKQSDKFKESAKEQLKRLKEMPYTNGTSSIQTISTLVGKFSPNKDGISGSFNTYHKKSDFSEIHDGKNNAIEGKPSRRCTQITFMPNDILSCNNGIKYTLLDKNNSHITNKVTTKPESKYRY